MAIPNISPGVFVTTLSACKLIAERECVYCGAVSMMDPRQCCQEGWNFDTLYAIYCEVNDRFGFQWVQNAALHNAHIEHFVTARLQEWCDESGLDTYGTIIGAG